MIALLCCALYIKYGFIKLYYIFISSTSPYLYIVIMENVYNQKKITQMLILLNFSSSVGATSDCVFLAPPMQQGQRDGSVSPGTEKRNRSISVIAGSWNQDYYLYRNLNEILKNHPNPDWQTSYIPNIYIVLNRSSSLDRYANGYQIKNPAYFCYPHLH